MSDAGTPSSARAPQSVLHLLPEHARARGRPLPARAARAGRRRRRRICCASIGRAGTARCSAEEGLQRLRAEARFGIFGGSPEPPRKPDWKPQGGRRARAAEAEARCGAEDRGESPPDRDRSRRDEDRGGRARASIPPSRSSRARSDAPRAGIRGDPRGDRAVLVRRLLATRRRRDVRDDASGSASRAPSPHPGA